MLRTPDSLTGTVPFSLALAIRRSVPGRNQNHAALVYKNRDQAWWLLHLGWYHELHHQPWEEFELFHWIPFQGLLPEVTEGLADQAVIMGARLSDSKIPYSIIYSPGPYFDAAMNYVRNSVGEGLTCSTFILAAFHRFGLPLLDEESWPRGRAGDARWGLRLIQALYKTCKTLAVPVRHFFEQVRQRWDLRRFRPEEVCATAALFQGDPLAFPDVEPASQQLLRELP